MTPNFSTAVDPVFQHVLGLLERIGRDETPAPSDERLRIRGWLDQAEGRLGHGQDWQLAKYALVSWIDDVLIERLGRPKLVEGECPGSRGLQHAAAE